MTATRNFMEDLGLALHSDRPYGRRKLHIDKGEVDPRSGGGLAVISHGRLDKDGALQNLEIRSWAVHPDGRCDKQILFQLETKQRNDAPEIDSLTVLGRDVPLHDQRNADNVMEAIRRIHVSLRDTTPQLPHIAQIFKDCDLENIVGETLPLPGFDLKQRLYFPATAGFNRAANDQPPPKIIMSWEALRPLHGLRKNTLDPDHSYIGRKEWRARGVIPAIGKRFEMVASYNKEAMARSLTMSQGRADRMEGEPSYALAHARWEILKPTEKALRHRENAELKTLELFDRNILNRGFRAVMGAIGVINLTNTDMLNGRDYPRTQDHLALHHLLDTAQSSSRKATASRFVLTSMGGNNLKEVFPGVGTDIGGNCKAVETQWTNPKTGEPEKLGAIFDLGMYLVRNGGEWTGAIPDVVEKLLYSRDVFFTHKHLDHLDGVIAYIKRGIIGPGHTLHLTAEASEDLNDKLNKAGIRKNDPRRPAVHILEGTGVLDLKDSDGIVRMSVVYGADAVPHSARCTPYIAYGRDDDRILGSYMYLGDARYDEDWFRDHRSAFWDPVTLMPTHLPAVDPGHFTPTYTELDGTSAKRDKRGAREAQVEDNLTALLTGPLRDRHAGIAMIGTNDGRRETLLRAGNRAQRRMTAFGAAVTFLFRVANKWGLNPYRLERPEAGKYNGLKQYLNWHAGQLGLKPMEFKSRTSKTVRDWFRTSSPGTILAFLSGSQGNPVEFESMTYKLSEGRSFFDADPATSKTARPTDLKSWALIFSQSAIPGNAKHQRALIKRLAGRGAAVLEAFDDHIRVHNPGSLGDRLLAWAKTQGKNATLEHDGSIVIEDTPIHASGHGCKEDLQLLLRKAQAKQVGMCHVDDPESVMAGLDMIEEEGRRSPGRVFANGEEVEITLDSVKLIGRIMSSIIMTREKAEEGKHYNKQLEATRYFNLSADSPHDDMGLRGNTGGMLEMHFGVEDERDVKRAQSEAFNRKAKADPLVHLIPKALRPYKSLRKIVAPGWKPIAA